MPTRPVTLELFGLASHNWQLVIDQLSSQYPNIKIKFTKFSTDEMKQALRVGASSGKMPDLWWNWGGSLASPYNRAGYALEITPEMQTEYRHRPECARPASASTLHKDGAELYGIPNSIGPFGFIYKKALFDKVRHQAADHLPELEKTAETLKANSVIPFSIGGKFSWMTMRYLRLLPRALCRSGKGTTHFLAQKTSWTVRASGEVIREIEGMVRQGVFPKGLPQHRSEHQSCRCSTTIRPRWCSIPRRWKPAASCAEDMSPADYGTFPLPTDHKPLRAPARPSQIQVYAKTPKDKQDRPALLFASLSSRGRKSRR